MDYKTKKNVDFFFVFFFTNLKELLTSSSSVAFLLPCFLGGRKTAEFLTPLEILSSGYYIRKRRLKVSEAAELSLQSRLLTGKPLRRTQNLIPCNLHLKTMLGAKYARHKRVDLHQIQPIFQVHESADCAKTTISSPLGKTIICLRS